MKSWYINKYNWLQDHPGFIKAIVYTCTWLSYLVYAVYIGSVIYLLLSASFSKLILFLVVPALGFLLETVIRAGLNKPRPYEVLKVPPLKPKHTKGKSFPSRHSFSAAMISMACFVMHPILAVCMMILTVIIGTCRVLMGVHWIKDVAVGIALGWILGYIGFFLL